MCASTECIFFLWKNKVGQQTVGHKLQTIDISLLFARRYFPDLRICYRNQIATNMHEPLYIVYVGFHIKSNFMYKDKQSWFW